jgi:hypothetical protein
MYQLVGRVEHFAKPIAVVPKHDGAGTNAVAPSILSAQADRYCHHNSKSPAIYVDGLWTSRASRN